MVSSLLGQGLDLTWNQSRHRRPGPTTQSACPRAGGSGVSWHPATTTQAIAGNLTKRFTSLRHCRFLRFIQVSLVQADVTVFGHTRMQSISFFFILQKCPCVWINSNNDLTDNKHLFTIFFSELFLSLQQQKKFQILVTVIDNDHLLLIFLISSCVLWNMIQNIASRLRNR